MNLSDLNQVELKEYWWKGAPLIGGWERSDLVAAELFRRIEQLLDPIGHNLGTIESLEEE